MEGLVGIELEPDSCFHFLFGKIFTEGLLWPSLGPTVRRRSRVLSSTSPTAEERQQNCLQLTGLWHGEI